MSDAEPMLTAMFAEHPPSLRETVQIQLEGAFSLTGTTTIVRVTARDPATPRRKPVNILPMGDNGRFSYLAPAPDQTPGDVLRMLADALDASAAQDRGADLAAVVAEAASTKESG